MSLVDTQQELVSKTVDSKTVAKSVNKLLKEYNKSVKENAKNIENVKLYTKQLLDNLDAIEITSIKNILIKHNVLKEEDGEKTEEEVGGDMICSFGCEYTTKSKACLGQHNRRCKLNPNNSKE